MGNVDINNKKVKVYCACSWFNDSQKIHMDKVYEDLMVNPTVDWENSYRPLDHQYQGQNVNEDDSILKDHYGQIAWGNETFTTDISGIQGSDIGVFAWEPDSPDEGQAWEMGYMKAINKPVVVVVPDGKKQKAMNLMLAYGATQVIEEKELHDLDLNCVYNKPYDGGLF